MSWVELPFTPPDLRRPIELTLRQLGMLTLKASQFRDALAVVAKYMEGKGIRSLDSLM